MDNLAIIIPCYNEEEALPYTIKKINSLLVKMKEQKLISDDSKAFFINDGSKDKTWQIIKEVASKNPNFSGINLSRNFGHQGALLAGLHTIQADMYVTIDADLQDNPECIETMVKEFYNGNDIVYGVRDKRKNDTLFKKYTALAFYKIMGLLGVNIIYNHADYRLMSKRAVNELKRFPERNLFLRAIIPQIGLKSTKVFYDRSRRVAGESKYPLTKMLAFAWNGISSFSIVPLRIVTLMGFITCILSFILILYSLFKYVSGGVLVGWTSMITVLTFFSGTIMLSIGIIGEYIGKIFTEVKHRPLYIIDEKVNVDE